MKTLLRKQADAAGVRPNYKVGHRHILWLCNEVGKSLGQKQKQDNWILSGLRGVGTLAWRPDLEQQKLVRCDEQQWAKDLPMGATGKMKSEWLEARYEWLDEAGKPVPPDYSEESMLRKNADNLHQIRCQRMKYEEDHMMVTATEHEI